MRYKIDNYLTKPGKTALAALLSVVMTGVCVTMAGQQHPVSPKASVQAESEEAPVTSKKPGEEPVRIHGHWVLDVKDRQGKVVEHRDFENSLKQTGTDILTLLLTGRAVMGGFAIRATQSTNGAMQTYQISPDAQIRPAFPCPIGTTNPSNTVYCSKGLQQSAVLPTGCSLANCTGNTSILLQGQFMAVAPISVDTLTTEPLICKNQIDTGTTFSVTPNVCTASTSSIGGIYTTYDFTGTTIAPLNIDTGQTLAITVTLSFS